MFHVKQCQGAPPHSIGPHSQSSEPGPTGDPAPPWNRRRWLSLLQSDSRPPTRPRRTRCEAIRRTARRGYNSAGPLRRRPMFHVKRSRDALTPIPMSPHCQSWEPGPTGDPAPPWNRRRWLSLLQSDSRPPTRLRQTRKARPFYDLTRQQEEGATEHSNIRSGDSHFGTFGQYQSGVAKCPLGR